MPANTGKKNRVTLVVLIVLIVAIAALAGLGWSQNGEITLLNSKVAQQNSQQAYLEYIMSTSESNELRAAVNYLALNYDPHVGLIRDSPGSDAFSLFSDNYLAVLAIRGYPKSNSTLAAIARNVTETLSRYSPSLGEALSEYMILGGNWSAPCAPIHDAVSYTVSNSTGGDVSATLNNGTGVLSPSDDAGVSILEAVCSLGRDDSSGWSGGFGQATKLFDGIGFCDSNSSFCEPKGGYRTSDLALYLFAERSQCGTTNETTDLAVTWALLQQQAPSGGYYIGYTGLGSESLTNTNTTSLAILALTKVTLCFT